MRYHEATGVYGTHQQLAHSISPHLILGYTSKEIGFLMKVTLLILFLRFKTAQDRILGMERGLVNRLSGCSAGLG
jgi:hypothetical protein